MMRGIHDENKNKCFHNVKSTPMNRQRSKQKICIHASRARLISHCLFSIIFPVPFFVVVFFAIYLNIIIVFKHTVVDRNIRTTIANDRSTYPRSLTHSSVVSKSCKFHFSPANCVHASTQHSRAFRARNNSTNNNKNRKLRETMRK